LLDEKLTFVGLNPQGNEAFKKADFMAAVEHYTSAIKADPSDHILPCNRALARLKLQQYVFHRGSRVCSHAYDYDTD
jgi:hypothetical protein